MSDLSSEDEGALAGRGAKLILQFGLEANEKLDSDFSCTFKSSLVHIPGRIYVFQECLGFKQTSPGTGSRLVFLIKYEDIAGIRKAHSELVFPTAIVVTGLDGKEYAFKDFAKRDAAYARLDAMLGGATRAGGGPSEPSPPLGPVAGLGPSGRDAVTASRASRGSDIGDRDEQPTAVFGCVYNHDHLPRVGQLFVYPDRVSFAQSAKTTSKPVSLTVWYRDVVAVEKKRTGGLVTTGVTFILTDRSQVGIREVNDVDAALARIRLLVEAARIRARLTDRSEEQHPTGGASLAAADDDSGLSPSMQALLAAAPAAHTRDAVSQPHPHKETDGGGGSAPSAAPWTPSSSSPSPSPSLTPACVAARTEQAALWPGASGAMTLGSPGPGRVPPSDPEGSSIHTGAALAVSGSSGESGGGRGQGGAGTDTSGDGARPYPNDALVYSVTSQVDPDDDSLVDFTSAQRPRAGPRP